MNRLKKYGFKDKNGHPLENCADYLAIFDEHKTALEQAVMRAEKAEKEMAGADAEITELHDELEDSRGMENDAPNVLCAIARLVGVYEHCQELGDDMGTMSIESVQELLAEKQKAEAEVVRLQQRVNELLSEELTDGSVRERIQLRGNMHEVLQKNERLTKMVDWLASHTADICASVYQDSYDLHWWTDCEWIEAARRAVAAGEE